MDDHATPIAPPTRPQRLPVPNTPDLDCPADVTTHPLHAVPRHGRLGPT